MKQQRRLVLFLLLVFAMIWCTQFASPTKPALAAVGTYTNTTFAQVDGATVNRTFVVAPGVIPAGDIISDVDIAINFLKTSGTCAARDGNNPFYNEIRFRLQNPGGTTVNLVGSIFGPPYGNVNVFMPAAVTVTFDDEAAGAPGNTPAAGTFDPLLPLALFDGGSPFGTWTLAIQDTTAGDPICFNNATLTITTVTPGVTVTPTTVNVTEGGATATYSVVLTAPPNTLELITITPATVGGQVTIAPATRLFTILNWNTPQTFTVTAVNDLIDEPSPHTATVTNALATTGGRYTGITAASVLVNITDNDTAAINAAPNPIAISEAGLTANYTLTLGSQPTGNVTVNVVPNAQCTVNFASRTFTPANWNVGQAITVTAVNDLVAEGAHTCVIANTGASTDANYQGLNTNVTANITDNDTAGLNVGPTTLNLAEGGATGTFNVSLTSQPIADVVFTVADDAQCDVSAPTLTFTAANWNVAQSVIVTATDDFVVEGAHNCAVNLTTASADPNYNNLTAGIVGNIADNDTAGLIVNPTALALAEGTPGVAYTVQLNSQPVAPVTITITDDAQCDVSTALLNFDGSNWNIAQPVIVTATDDAVAEGNHTCTIGNASASADPNYVGLTANVTGNIVDNDSASLVIAPAAVNLTEGAPGAGYTVQLNSQPVAPVTITVTDDAQCDISAAVLNFDGSNWNIAQTITVTATDDFIAEGNHTCTIGNASASADPNYVGLTVNVTGNITDNDTAALNVTPTAINITEGGATATYNVVLNSQPIAAVTITIAPTAQCTVSAGTLNFDGSNWNVAQTITVTAVDDTIAEGPHACQILNTSASTDTNYNALTVTVQTTITDNDTSGLVINPTTVGVTEGGATATYAVSLSSQPVAAVTVNMASDAQCTISAGVLNLDGSNWNVPQNITVTAIDDLVSEGPHTCAITIASTSTDPNYNNLAGGVTVNITDNDSAGINVSPQTLVVVEGQLGSQFLVALGTQPAPGETVVITLSWDGTQLNAGPASLTFDASNWNVPQSVGVEAINDAVDEGTTTDYPILLSASSSAAYNGMTATQTTTIVDDDGPDVIVGYHSPPCVINDGRINDNIALDCAPPIAIYCQGSDIEIYLIDGPKGAGRPWVYITAAEIEAAGVPSDDPIILEDRDPVLVARLSTGEFYALGWWDDPYHEDGVKRYEIIWDACPATNVYHGAH